VSEAVSQGARLQLKRARIFIPSGFLTPPLTEAAAVSFSDLRCFLYKRLIFEKA